MENFEIHMYTYKIFKILRMFFQFANKLFLARNDFLIGKKCIQSIVQSEDVD